MDVALLVTSTSLSWYLPGCVSQFQTRAEQCSKATAIGLSLGLFSLSILEAVPVSWLIILSHNNGAYDDSSSSSSYWWTISNAYWALLWCVALFIVIVLPSLAGIALAQTLVSSLQDIFTFDRDNHKYLLHSWKKMCPWWMRFLLQFVSIILFNMFRICQRLCFRRRRSNTVLVMTNNPSNDSLKSFSSEATSEVPTQSKTSSASRASTIIGTLCGVFFILLTIRAVGSTVVKTSTDKNPLSVIVSWLCAVGLVISSMLNGFGSVSMPQSCLSGLYLKPVRPEVIRKLTAERESVHQALEFKKQNLRDMRVSTTGFLQRTFSDIGDEVSNRKLILQTEIEFLEVLYQELGEDLDEVQLSQKLAVEARTTVGTIKSYLGVIFSILLLIRIFNAAMNIWKSYTINVDTHKIADQDLVTTVLLWLAGHNFVSPQQYSMASQIISLALTAFLSFSQVRNFLRTVTAVNRRLGVLYENFLCSKWSTKKSTLTSKTKSISLYGGFAGYLAALTGCCYSLSCIVLIKMMLPEEFCEGFSTALGGMDVFTIHSSVVNTVFASSAGISAVILGMLFGIQRQNNFRHTASTHAFRGADVC